MKHILFFLLCLFLCIVPCREVFSNCHFRIELDALETGLNKASVKIGNQQRIKIKRYNDWGISTGNCKKDNRSVWIIDREGNGQDGEPGVKYHYIGSRAGDFELKYTPKSNFTVDGEMSFKRRFGGKTHRAEMKPRRVKVYVDQLSKLDVNANSVICPNSKIEMETDDIACGKPCGRSFGATKYYYEIRATETDALLYSETVSSAKHAFDLRYFSHDLMDRLANAGKVSFQVFAETDGRKTETFRNKKEFEFLPPIDHHYYSLEGSPTTCPEGNDGEIVIKKKKNLPSAYDGKNISYFWDVASGENDGTSISIDNYNAIDYGQFNSLPAGSTIKLIDRLGEGMYYPGLYIPEFGCVLGSNSDPNAIDKTSNQDTTVNYKGLLQPVIVNQKIHPPTEITSTITKNNICFGAETGAIKVSLSGGTGRYNVTLKRSTQDINITTTTTTITTIQRVPRDTTCGYWEYGEKFDKVGECCTFIGPTQTETDGICGGLEHCNNLGLYGTDNCNQHSQYKCNYGNYVTDSSDRTKVYYGWWDNTPRSDRKQKNFPDDCTIYEYHTAYHTLSTQKFSEGAYGGLETVQELTNIEAGEEYTFEGLKAGKYYLEVSSADCVGESASAYKTVASLGEITQKDPISIDPESVSGTGYNIKYTASGSSGGPFTYRNISKTPSQGNHATSGSSITFTDLTQDTELTFRIEENGGCQQDFTETPFSDYDPPAFTDVTTKDIECRGNNTGAIEYEVSYASGYSGTVHLYKDGVEVGSRTASSGSFMGLAPGEYTIKVFDTKSCSGGCSYAHGRVLTLTEPEAVSITIPSDRVTHALGVGIPSGSFEYQLGPLERGASYDVFISGPIPESLFSVSGSSDFSLQTHQNLLAGTYQVHLSNNCFSISETIEIQEPDTSLSVVAEGYATRCFGSSNGRIEARASGGWGGYKYALYDADNISQLKDYTRLNVFKDLSAGDYTVRVEDRYGASISFPVTVSSREQLRITQTDVFERDQDGNCLTPVSVHTLSCFDSRNAFLTVQAEGGVLPYQYNFNNTSYSNTDTLKQVEVGIYTITVRDSLGCQTSPTTISVTAPDTLKISSEVLQSVQCENDAVGKIAVSVTGGVPFYRFNASINAEDTSIIAEGQVQLYENLLSENTSGYRFNVQDQNGCEAVAYQPLIPEGLFEIETIEFTEKLCNKSDSGKIHFRHKDGVRPFSYQWRYYQHQEDDTVGVSLEADTLLEQLSAGIYTVVITDATGCSGEFDFFIGGQKDNPLKQMIEVEPLTCYGSANGLIRLKAEGGKKIAYGASFPGYTFTINGTTTIYSEEIIPKDSIMHVTVTDAFDCEIDTTVHVIEPSPLQISHVSQKDIVCKYASTGEVVVAAVGGNGGYQYAPLGGIFSPEDTIRGLPETQKSIIVQDQKGCSDTLSIQFWQPDSLLNYRFTIDTIVCKGETSDFHYEVSGGLADYDIRFDTLENLPEATSVYGLYAGEYHFKITDSLGCVIEDIITIAEPESPLSVSVDSIQNLNCFESSDGKIYLSGHNGWGDYRYSKNSLTDSDFQVLPVFDGLDSGTYRLYIQDRVGCIDTIYQYISQPDSLDYTLLENHAVTCTGAKDGQLKVAVEGGTFPYSYYIGNDTLALNSDSLIKNISGGDYKLLIFDAHGCRSFETPFTTLESAEKFVASVDSTSLATCGVSDGKVYLTFTGGTAPFSIPSRNFSVNHINGVLDSVFAGSYTMVATDLYGCKSVIQPEVKNPQSPDLTTKNLSETTCSYSQDGAIYVASQYVSPPKSYKVWTADSTLVYDVPQTHFSGLLFSDTLKLFKGDYFVVAQDEKLCLSQTHFTISGPERINTSVDFTEETCTDYADGIIQLKTITGGTAPYSYVLQDSNTAVSSVYTKPHTFKKLGSGAYNFRVTDAHDCIYNAPKITFRNPDTLKLRVAQVQNPICYQQPQGKIDMKITGGIEPYNFQWDDIQSTATSRENLMAGIYYGSSIIDARNCKRQAIVDLRNPPSIRPNVERLYVLCDGDVAEIDMLKGNNETTQWFSESGRLISQEQRISLKTAGNYLAVREDTVRNCREAAKFSIETRDLSFDGAFLASSEITADKEITFVDVSWPVPDSIRWDILEGGFHIKARSNYSYTILFDTAGVYNAILTAYKDGCSKTVEKAIIVGPPETGSDDFSGSETFVQRANLIQETLYPNPNQGAFTAEFLFDAPAALSLRIVSLEGREVFRNQYSEKMHHKIPLKLALPSGSYFLFVVYQNKSNVIKFLVH